MSSFNADFIRNMQDAMKDPDWNTEDYKSVKCWILNAAKEGEHCTAFYIERFESLPNKDELWDFLIARGFILTKNKIHFMISW